MTGLNTSSVGGESTGLQGDITALGEKPSQEFALFFKAWLRQGRKISAATPSSYFLSKEVCSVVDWDKPGTIIELGAGTGPITEYVLKNLRPHHKFVSIERDKGFFDVLKRRFPNAPLVHGDATDLDETLAGLGIEKADYVLSGLPTPSLPAESFDRLKRWMDRNVFDHGGVFSQLTVVPLFFWPFYRRHFLDVKYKFIGLNIPPGGVYKCRGVRQESLMANEAAA